MTGIQVYHFQRTIRPSVACSLSQSATCRSVRSILIQLLTIGVGRLATNVQVCSNTKGLYCSENFKPVRNVMTVRYCSTKLQEACLLLASTIRKRSSEWNCYKSWKNRAQNSEMLYSRRSPACRWPGTPGLAIPASPQKTTSTPFRLLHVNAIVARSRSRKDTTSSGRLVASMSFTVNASERLSGCSRVSAIASPTSLISGRRTAKRSTLERQTRCGGESQL